MRAGFRFSYLKSYIFFYLFNPNTTYRLYLSPLQLSACLTCQVFVVTLFAFTFLSSPTGRSRCLPSHSQVLQMFFFSGYRNYSLPIVTKDLPRIWQKEKTNKQFHHSLTTLVAADFHSSYLILWNTTVVLS